MRIRFGDCLHDSETRELLRGGERVHLSPKGFDLLGLLLEGREQFLRGQAARAQVAGIGGIAERMRQWFSANF